LRNRVAECASSLERSGTGGRISYGCVGTSTFRRALNYMPRFHFDVAGAKVFDSFGAVLSDTEAARTHAIELATNVGKHTLEPQANAVRVIDDKGCVLFRVPIRRSA
jgi:hypothetical protein